MGSRTRILNSNTRGLSSRVFVESSSAGVDKWRGGTREAARVLVDSEATSQGYQNSRAIVLVGTDFKESENQSIIMDLQFGKIREYIQT